MSETISLLNAAPLITQTGNWRFGEHDISHEIEEMLANLLELSAYPYIWYGFIGNDHQTIFKNNLNISVCQIQHNEACLQHLSAQKSFPILDFEFDDIIKSIEYSMSLMPKHASLLKMSYRTDLNLYFILFSENPNEIQDLQWQSLEIYISQQQKYFLLKQKNSELESRLAVAESINAGRSKYLSMIAHDLRAPFHGIMGCADILLHEPETLDAEATIKLVEYIYDTSTSTYALLEGLLNWSMAEGGQFHIKKEHFRINDVLQNVFDLLFASAYKKNIYLKGDVEAGLFAYADIHMVTSILQNLISNALKFTAADKGRQILVSARAIDGYAKINVQDTGVGMTASQIEKLFRDNATPSSQGTSGEKGMGLGLSLCKQFLSLNDGSMTINSTLNRGTTFSVYLPLGNKYA